MPLSPAVLLVDDEPDILALYSEVLGAQGISAIDTAVDGNDALAKVRARAYDLILSDLGLPGIDGVTLLQEVKRVNPKVQVIIITGTPTLRSAIAAFRSDVFDYLEKPVQVKDLQESIQRAILRIGVEATVLRLMGTLPGEGQAPGESLLGHLCFDRAEWIVEAEPRCLAALGLTSESIQGRRLSSIPELSWLSGDVKATLSEGLSSTRRQAILGLGKDLRVLTYSVAPIAPAVHTQDWAVALIVDVTGCQKALRERRARERMVALGEIVRLLEGQHADHLRSVARSALSVVRHLKRLQEPRPDVRGILEASEAECRAIASELDRLRTEMGRLWTFSRVHLPDTGPACVDLNELIRDVVEYPANWHGRGRLELALGHGLGRVQGRREDLILLVSNLLTNAFRATEKFGQVRISTRARPGMAILSVADEGVGISAGQMENVFDAFYATDGGPSMGLGLALVQKIVDDHDGAITVESGLVGGATFTVALPLASG